MDPQPLIFDLDENAFESQVIEASGEIPVAVDFWAEWCGPCRSLTPVLEKVVTSLAGRVRLAKINTDKNQQLAASLGIRSLPTVKLFKHAQVVDEFFGAYPESELRAFFARNLEQPADPVVAEVREMLASGKIDQALARLTEALNGDPENNHLRLDLATVQILHGDYSEAEATLGKLPADAQQDEGARRMFALLHFHRLCDSAPSAETLAGAIQQDPADLDSRLKLSARKVLEENYQAAMDELLEIIRRDRRYRDELARKSMLSIFELLGKGNPLVARYRSLMAAAIY